jgi:hypothetical protein
MGLNLWRGSHQKKSLTMAKLYDFKLGAISKNPHFEDGVLLMDKEGLTDESLRSCLICNNSDKKNTKQAIRYVKQKRVMADNYEPIYFLQKAHKWGVTFIGDIIDTETGEFLKDEIYQTTDIELGVKRKRKAIKSFTDFYEPLYQLKKVSCMFFTLTQANQSNDKLANTLNAIKKRFERHNLPILGYLWVSEVSKNGHWHYHLAIATKRVYWKQIPKWAKIDDLWGRRTQIEFIRKSIGAYLGKYIGKDNIGRIMNFRSYGKSSKFIGV